MPDTPPTHGEIKDQLRRVLSSPRFKNAPRPSAFLALVATRRLKGKMTPGRVVAESLFPDKFLKGESPDVRVTASNLRKTLKKYYALEGKEDLVIISFPKSSDDESVRSKRGEAYTPKFSYNPTFGLMTALRIADLYLQRWSYSHLLNAFEIYLDLLTQSSGHLGPALGVIEASCVFDYRGWTNPKFENWTIDCGRLFKEVEPAGIGYWKFWAIQGYFHYLQDANDSAATAFQKALALDRLKTETYLPYVTFLLKSGHEADAITLANNYLGLHLEDGAALAQFGLFLVMAGRIDGAADHLSRSLELDPGNCAAHEALAAIWLWQNDLTRVLFHMRMLKSLSDPLSYALAVADLEAFEQKLGIESKIGGLLKQDVSACADVIVRR